MLTELVKKYFRKLFEVSLWLILIGWAISGAKMGYSLGGYNGSVGYGLLGFIFGTLAGVISTVFLGGLVATFLKMSESLDEIRDHLLGKPPQNIEKQN